ncbi:amidohydrolase family protein [Sphingosinicella terrae]|uniref:amidohydrolase family protein n=1 Tax=Sphingosinicella terrae TaxID=2172047 RepID=UPI000E0E0158|nr:amidohydrolase family protein [Sphingosinicella terrae]
MSRQRSRDSVRQSLRSFLALIGLCLSALGSTACAQPGEAPGGTTAFVGVNVIPMDRERVLENQVVIVRDGRIVSVEPAAAAQVPADARRIDAAGRWLMPGLAEMHGHVPGPEDPGYAEDVLFLYVANGVTTVRSMAGHPGLLALRERIAGGDLLGPTLHAASPWLSAEAAATPEAARAIVRQHRQSGYDLIKIGSLPRDAYGAMAEEAHAIGLPFGGHIPQDVGLVGALEARQASIDHFDRYVEFMVPQDRIPAGQEPGFFGSGWVGLIDEGRIADAVARTVAAGTWNVPTLSLVEHLASSEPGEAMIRRPEMRYMPRRVLDGWAQAKREFQASATFQPEAARALVDLRRRLLHALHEAGAPIALGSDAPQFFNVPGFSIHHEMGMMAAAGLSPYAVLESGTRNPARYFGTPDAFGTVAPGRRADLILLEANPLEDLDNVQRRVGVMVRGRWLPEAEIQARLEQIARDAAAS